MKVVLGIDAAWTQAEPSGVALLASSGDGWSCRGVAPSYDAFIDLAHGRTVDWQASQFAGSTPNIATLLDSVRKLCGASADVIAIDMPVATVPITGRRVADVCVSRAFGSRGCSTHSPSSVRPGILGQTLSRDFETTGYAIAHANVPSGIPRRLVEVYPHIALLNLLGRNYRVPYKVGKSSKYWPRSTIDMRKANLVSEFQLINQALMRLVDSTGITIPNVPDVPSLSHLKRYEDALDALVSAWVGACYLAGHARPYGDNTAAIWCP